MQTGGAVLFGTSKCKARMSVTLPGVIHEVLILKKTNSYGMMVKSYQALIINVEILGLYETEGFLCLIPIHGKEK